VLKFAHEHDCVLLTCNRDDFLDLAANRPHNGIVVVIRRTRAAERAALLRLLERAGEAGSGTTSTSRNRLLLAARRHSIRLVGRGRLGRS
jgi:hypothetical protein